jgi:Mrp family chromosome partitioning ATPase
MVASPGSEPTRAVVVINLATVCTEIGQRVAVLSTAGIEAHEGAPETLGTVGPLDDRERDRRLTGPVRPADVEDLLEDTSVPGVSFLDLHHFVANPTQVVIRVPEVLEALRDVVDVVILEVPSFLSIHHGQGLAPLADVVLVVGERRLTTFDQLHRTSAVLKRLGAPVVGMVLTNVPPRSNEQLPEELEEYYDEQLHEESVEDHDERIDDETVEGAYRQSNEEPPEGREPFIDVTTVRNGTLSDDTLVDHAPVGSGAWSENPADRDAPRPEA